MGWVAIATRALPRRTPTTVLLGPRAQIRRRREAGHRIRSARFRVRRSSGAPSSRTLPLGSRWHSTGHGSTRTGAAGARAPHVVRRRRERGWPGKVEASYHCWLGVLLPGLVEATDEVARHRWSRTAGAPTVTSSMFHGHDVPVRTAGTCLRAQNCNGNREESKLVAKLLNVPCSYAFACSGVPSWRSRALSPTALRPGLYADAPASRMREHAEHLPQARPAVAAYLPPFFWVTVSRHALSARSSPHSVPYPRRQLHPAPFSSLPSTPPRLAARLPHLSLPPLPPARRPRVPLASPWPQTSAHPGPWTPPLPPTFPMPMCSHPKLARLVCPVRPVGPTGQTGVVKDHTIQFGLHHWIGLVD
jgi:hypothetical protein